MTIIRYMFVLLVVHFILAFSCSLYYEKWFPKNYTYSSFRLQILWVIQVNCVSPLIIMIITWFILGFISRELLDEDGGPSLVVTVGPVIGLVVVIVSSIVFIVILRYSYFVLLRCVMHCFVFMRYHFGYCFYICLFNV